LRRASVSFFCDAGRFFSSDSSAMLVSAIDLAGANTILTSRRSRSRPVHGRLVSGVGKRQRRSGSLVIDVTVRSDLASPSRSRDAGNRFTACQRQRLRDRRVCRSATGANPSSLPSNGTVTSRCSRRLALPICGRSFPGQLDRRLSSTE
jgi:hypothetical protein